MCDYWYDWSFVQNMVYPKPWDSKLEMGWYPRGGVIGAVLFEASV